MLRFTLREASRFALGILGALLMACAIAALSVHGASSGVRAFFAAMVQKLGAMLRLDFGLSAMSGMSAQGELAQHLPQTGMLVFCGAVMALAFGIPLGLMFGAGPLRRASAPLIQIIAAAPLFCAGLMLAYLAYHVLHWPVSINLQIQVTSPLFHLTAAEMRVVALPALTVGAAGAAAVQLALRRAAAEAAMQPWRHSLRRMGLSALEIERVYVAPQVFAGLLQNLGEVVLALLSAAAVAEWVFHFPGAADLFVKSVALRDWNVAALVLFVFASATFLADFVGRIGAQALAPSGAQS